MSRGHHTGELAPDSQKDILATLPADCKIEYETDFGLYRSGARNGIPFDEKVKKPKSRQVKRKLTSKEVDEILDRLF